MQHHETIMHHAEHIRRLFPWPRSILAQQPPTPQDSQTDRRKAALVGQQGVLFPTCVFVFVTLDDEIIAGSCVKTHQDRRDFATQHESPQPTAPCWMQV